MTSSELAALQSRRHSPPAGKPRRRRGEVKAERVARQRAAEERREAFERSIVRTPFAFSFWVYVETPNPVRGSHGSHWSVTNMRAKQRAATDATLSAFRTSRPSLPCIVKMVRMSSGELDDDNLRPALKSVRDAIAAWIGVDDKRGTGVEWKYDQKKMNKWAKKCVWVHIFPEGIEPAP